MAVVSVLSHRRRPGRREVAVGVLLGFTQASVLVLETYGVSLTSATNAGLLISLTILLTPVLECAASRRWLPRGFFVAAAVAMTGVALLVTGNGMRAPSTGDALMLGAALIRALHVTASGQLTRGRSYDTITLTLLQTVVGAVVCTVAAGPALTRATVNLSAEQWLGLAYLGLGCTVFAFLVQLWAVRRTSAARASLLLGTEPVWAVIVGLSLGGDTLSIVGATGAVLVVAGTTWGQRVESRFRNGPRADRSAQRTAARPAARLAARR
jgi:drug/metabolite transporter (DMT)-like permease